MIVPEDTHGNRVLTKNGLTEPKADEILRRFAINKPHSTTNFLTRHRQEETSSFARGSRIACTSTIASNRP